MTLSFGAMADPLHKQLGVSRQRLGAAAQRAADALVLLHVYGLLPDAEVHRARARLARRIGKVLGQAPGRGEKP